MKPCSHRCATDRPNAQASSAYMLSKGCQHEPGNRCSSADASARNGKCRRVIGRRFREAPAIAIGSVDDFSAGDVGERTSHSAGQVGGDQDRGIG